MEQKGMELGHYKEISESDLDLHTTEGFIKRFWVHLKGCRTQVEAYNLTNADYKAIFSRNKYSNYDSFRVVKNRLTKKQ